jgi:hypothetical protein
MRRPLFGELLSRLVGLSQHDIAEVLADQAISHRRFGEIAMAFQWVRPQEVWQAWWAQLGAIDRGGCPAGSWDRHPGAGMYAALLGRGVPGDPDPRLWRANAMALIAPGAFLWLTFSEQSAYGAPSAGSAMWLGMLLALLLCLATAVSYAELSKLYPGAGSSYFFAEQAFLSKKAGLQVGPHLQVHGRLGQPPLLLGLSRRDGLRDVHLHRLHGRAAFPNTFNVAEGSPLLMILFASSSPSAFPTSPSAASSAPPA